MMRYARATTRGLLVTAVLAVLLVFLFDLSSVASLGAATSLKVDLLVNIGALKLIKARNLALFVLWTGVFSCTVAIVTWSLQQ